MSVFIKTIKLDGNRRVRAQQFFWLSFLNKLYFNAWKLFYCSIIECRSFARSGTTISTMTALISRFLKKKIYKFFSITYPYLTQALIWRWYLYVWSGWEGQARVWPLTIVLPWWLEDRVCVITVKLCALQSVIVIHFQNFN